MDPGSRRSSWRLRFQEPAIKPPVIHNTTPSLFTDGGCRIWLVIILICHYFSQKGKTMTILCVRFF
ncbi:hypothetical protein HanRHA438_Chr15g0719121 [Helianthus annuus]|nr:hypothetical protein HanRHA438_Chr15g0719121 [Helianthus annuus]